MESVVLDKHGFYQEHCISLVSDIAAKKRELVEPVNPKKKEGSVLKPIEVREPALMKNEDANTCYEVCPQILSFKEKNDTLLTSHDAYHICHLTRAEVSLAFGTAYCESRASVQGRPPKAKGFSS